LVLEDKANITDEEYAQPFVALIQFSDCEGCIGPRVTKMLSEQFEKYRPLIEEWYEKNSPAKYDPQSFFIRISPEENRREEAKRVTMDKDSFILKYDKMASLFEFACENGCIEFC
jgi:hypothetical protein